MMIYGISEWNIYRMGYDPNISYEGFHSHGGTPNSRMVCGRENPNLKWNDLGGTPIFGNIHMIGDSYIIWIGNTNIDMGTLGYIILHSC